ncbi:hypothetical protein NC653_041131 [Populus alba x Populus x berolinensis]|uniref:Uncharacterized protein n=1 Tax=Populus alba x Populus x berolinensis TaxID=444605 RepID=A0AAD6PNU3_9ROSI|nr:hypothetical protein NC653_041131 [Populus alba x Populus x berolinensis]
MKSFPNYKKTRKNEFPDTLNETVLPGLPDHLFQNCLMTSLPPSILFSVSHAWRRLLYSSLFATFFSLYALRSASSSYPTTKDNQVDRISSLELMSFDPISSLWRSVPSIPKDPPLHLLHRHPSFLSRTLSVQSLTVSNHVVLISGTTQQFVPALSRPLVFHPESNKWFFGPPFTSPRRWCATGSVHGRVYVASGVNWSTVQWRRYKGKLYMVNVKGNAPKEGLVYDVEENQWNDMPRGMLAGWNRPAATMNEDAIYVVNEVTGALSEYDCKKDCWKKVIELPELKLAEQIAAGRGRVCVVCANGETIVVVDVVARPARFWVVEPPQGQQVAGLHILPRMSS